MATKYLDYNGLVEVQKKVDSLYARKTNSVTPATLNATNADLTKLTGRVEIVEGDVAKLKAIDGSIYKVDTSLAVASKTDGKIHLIPTSTTETGDTRDTYDEYVYLTDHWELVGKKKVSLSGYLTESAANSTFMKNADYSRITETEIDDMFK